MTLEALNRRFLDRITPSLGEAEAKATARLVMEDTLGVTPVILFTRGERLVEPETVERFDGIAARIAAGEPPQYVLGRARFMGMDLRVTPDVLIPRPETAGLVDMITDRYGSRTDVKVLDAGTGSGCIAIALARALPFARVEGIDISDKALAVARSNAAALGAKVVFDRVDILNPGDRIAPGLDVLVSNPPYITDSERPEMEARVKDYEPAAALFVPDSDPLKFYKALLVLGRRILVPGGALYFEINPLHADALARRLTADGYDDVQILPDYRGLLRYAVAFAPQL